MVTMEHTSATKITTTPPGTVGLPGIWVSDADPIDKAMTDNAVIMYRMAHALLGDGAMGSGELRYLATSLLRSLGDVLDVMGVDHE